MPTLPFGQATGAVDRRVNRIRRYLAGGSVNLPAGPLPARGRERLAEERLELFLPEQWWNEVGHELPRRIAAFAARRGIPDKAAVLLTETCFAAVDSNVVVVVEAAYSPMEDEGRARSVRDPNDWPLVACALALDAAIWTEDNDLLGTGVATWTTATIQGWLDRAGGS